MKFMKKPILVKRAPEMNGKKGIPGLPPKTGSKISGGRSDYTTQTNTTTPSGKGVPQGRGSNSMDRQNSVGKIKGLA
jgi:hypothetical protein